jgi:preprotein translocase subunit SecG
MLYGIILVIHVFVCVALMIAVLLQSGKGGGLAGAFGGGAGSQAIFGGRGAATFLSNATTILGVAFMVTSLTLALLGGAGTASRTRSLIREDLERRAPVPTETPAGVTPGAGAPGTAAPPGGASSPPGGAVLPGATVLPGGATGAAPSAPGTAGPAGTSAATGTTVPAGGSPAGSSPGGATGGR